LTCYREQVKFAFVCGDRFGVFACMTAMFLLL